MTAAETVWDLAESNAWSAYAAIEAAETAIWNSAEAAARATYDQAMAAADAAWAAAEASAWAAYDVAMDTAESNWDTAADDAWSAYESAMSAADAAWDLAEAAAWAEYETAVAAAETAWDNVEAAAWAQFETALSDAGADWVTAEANAWSEYQTASGPSGAVTAVAYSDGEGGSGASAPTPSDRVGKPHSGPTSGNGQVQRNGKAAHREFGKGTKLPNGKITDKLEKRPNKIIVNELKPDTRLANASKLKQAEAQLAKQMAGAKELHPNKTIIGRIWSWTKTASGKVKFAVVSRWEYVVDKKGGKWIAKKIPFVGIGVGLLGWGSDVHAKGPIGGTVNSGLDMVPGVGLANGVVEVIRGQDIIPNQ